MNQKAQVLHRDERKIDWQNLQTLIEIVPHIAGDGMVSKEFILYWQRQQYITGSNLNSTLVLYEFFWVKNSKITVKITHKDSEGCHYFYIKI